MVDIDDNDAEELRLHIHHLLHDYSRTYYTTNYIEFTENLVSEVWISFFITRFLFIYLFLSLSKGWHPFHWLIHTRWLSHLTHTMCFLACMGYLPCRHTMKLLNRKLKHVRIWSKLWFRLLGSLNQNGSSGTMIVSSICWLNMLRNSTWTYLFTCRWERSSLMSTHIYCPFSKVTTEHIQTRLKEAISFFRSSRPPEKSENRIYSGWRDRRSTIIHSQYLVRLLLNLLHICAKSVFLDNWDYKQTMKTDQP